jgi:hypothetical protein
MYETTWDCVAGLGGVPSVTSNRDVVDDDVEAASMHEPLSGSQFTESQEYADNDPCPPEGVLMRDFLCAMFGEAD